MLTEDYQRTKLHYHGHAIQTYTIGQGEHVIFSLPSFPQSGLSYLPLAQSPYWHNYKFVTLDLPGWAGDSENVFAHKVSLSKVDTYVDIARHLIQHNKAKKLSIIGYSFGAAIAFRLAAQHPNKVSNLVLVSPIIFGRRTKDTPQWRLLRAMKFINQPHLLKRFFYSRMKSKISELHPVMSDRLREKYLYMFSHADGQVMLDSLWELFNNDNRDLLSAVAQIPQIMVVNSVDEPKIYRQQAEFLRRHLTRELTFKIHGTHDDFIIHPTPRKVEAIVDFLTQDN